MNENRRKSDIQEKRITKSLKQIKEESKRAIASGAKWNCKSDVISEHFRVEAKTKASPSSQITLKKEWFDKISNEAFETNKTPVLVFSFGTSTDYYCLEDRDFLALMEELFRLRELAKLRPDGLWDGD
jgi:hypothetical protein